MMQNTLLKWLYSNIKDKNEACSNTITQLKCSVNGIKNFAVGNEYVHFIEEKTDEKECKIISDLLDHHTMPCAHNIPPMNSLYTVHDNKKPHQKWSKLKNIYTYIPSFCINRQQALHKCEQDIISISFLPKSETTADENLNHLDPIFIYSRIMKEILLTIKFNKEDFQKFIDWCQAEVCNNENESKKISEFAEKYRAEEAVIWYSYLEFLYSMLNRALRLTDVNTIIKMGFFITDLHRHIERLHKEQVRQDRISETLTVYRGQGLSKTDFDQVKKTKNGLMSFNCFLSTTADYDVALAFAESNRSDPELVGILFAMTVHLSKSTTPFALIKNISRYLAENEVLFSMHTVFRVHDIEAMDDSQRLFKVNLSLTDENDKDFLMLTNCIRKETFPDKEGWYRLGLVLIKMGRSDKAVQVYQVLLDQTTDETEKASIYNQIGWTKCNLGEYKDAMTFFEQSLEIKKRILRSTHPNLASSYNNIGAAYQRTGEYSKALLSCEKALEIDQQLLPLNHPDLAGDYSNIGLLYENTGEHSKALSSYKKALEIRQTSLPSNHPDLACSFNNIGIVYCNIGQYSSALLFHQNALKIRQKSFPPNHPDLAYSYNNMGIVYRHMGNYSEALLQYEKALTIRKQVLPSNHSTLATSYNNMAVTYEAMHDYSQACEFYERAVNIGQQSLPPNHPNLLKWRKNLNRIKTKF
jgi:tetratricopeptide (TPR) repeat protein